MSEPNWEMIARVRDRIAEVGNEHCDMDYYSEGGVLASGTPACGTTACIGGWALALHYGVFNQDGREYESAAPIGFDAAQVLGLKRGIPRLFGLEEWPERYRQIANDEGHAKGMLAILDAILDRQIDADTLQPL